MGGGKGGAQVDLPAEEAAALADTARRAGYENLLRLLQQLLASEAMVRRSETGTLAVEIAWLRAAELPKLVRVEEILAGGGASGAAGGAGGNRPQIAEPRRAAPAAAVPREAEAPRPVAPGPAALPAAAAPVATEATGAPTAPRSIAAASGPPPGPPPAAARLRSQPRSPASPPSRHPWHRGRRPRPSPRPIRCDAFLDEVARLKPPLAALLKEAEDLRFADGSLQIILSPGDRMLRGRLERDNNRQVLEQALARAWGEGTRWELVEGAGRAPEPAPAAIGAVKLEMVAENPTIQTILDIFGGTVEKVEEHGSQ